MAVFKTITDRSQIAAATPIAPRAPPSEDADEKLSGVFIPIPRALTPDEESFRTREEAWEAAHLAWVQAVNHGASPEVEAARWAARARAWEQARIAGAACR